MTDFPTLPQLELGEHASPFDEAVILIGGHEEETIRIECAGALELADRLIRYVNAHAQIVRTLTAAAESLRLCNSPSLAQYCETLSKQLGAAA